MSFSGSKNLALRRSDILDRAEKLAKLLGTQVFIIFIWLYIFIVGLLVSIKGLPC